MMIWYDHAWSWWGWLAMTAGMVVFWGLVISGVVVLVRYTVPGQGSTAPAAPSPEQVLAERFARGEIDEAEYRQRLDTLRTSRSPSVHR